MLSSSVGAKTNPGASCIVIPVRSKNTLERRDEVNVTAIRHFPCERLEFSGISKEANRLDPADGRSCNLNCAFKGVVRDSEVVAHSGEHAVLRLHNG